MTWGIWGERAGAPQLSAVNKRRISAHGYCGKWRADITTNSVTLCKISTCGYFCRYFAWIGDISNILAVRYFGWSPVSGPLWKFFHKGLVKQNSAHWQAFCLGELTWPIWRMMFLMMEVLKSSLRRLMGSSSIACISQEPPGGLASQKSQKFLVH